VSGPLAGVRVLDLSRVLAGPWATQLLADLGADVIKIEHPRGGDETRAWGPPYLAPPGDAGNEAAPAPSAYFLSANRNKRSVAVDLSTEGGRRVIRALAQKSDVLVENFKVGTLARYGLGYADLAPLNPRLVYCSITAYGQDGPRRDEPGYDAMIQAAGGLMSITGAADGEPGAGPQKVGVAVADLMAGMYAANGIQAALHARARTGNGQHVEIALFDSQLAWLANQALNYLVTGVSPVRRGTGHPNIVPYQAFATRDGHLMLAVGNDRQFARCAAVLGMPALADDPRYATNEARVRSRDALVAILAPVFATADTNEWLRRLGAAGVPCGPVNTIAQAFADPQAIHRGARVSIDHPALGPVPGVRNPLRFSHTPVVCERAPPLLGEHTDEVLGDVLGLTRAEIDDLRRSGAVA
jgi:crotonobetainyl-CoA:carnitine CoA-transferase CaiB-like acyl-CoA transferase